MSFDYLKITKKLPVCVGAFTLGFLTSCDFSMNAEPNVFQVGAEHQNPIVLTAHDVHTENGRLAWNHETVRRGDVSSYGYYSIEVIEAGNYLVELSHWPFESKLTFRESAPAIAASKYRDGLSYGAGVIYKEAVLEIIDGKKFNVQVDNSIRSAHIRCDLPAGKHKMKFYFKDENGKRTGANYTRIRKFKSFTSEVIVSDFCESLTPISRILETEGYTVWCNSPIYGPDGKVHVFFSKIPVGGSWLVNSEIAHAVADSPAGPYTELGIVLTGQGGDQWDAHTIHNPTIHKVGDKYALFYIGNNLDEVKRNQMHQAGTQKIGLAIADDIHGPYKRVGKDGLILDISNDRDDWDSYITCNPFFLQHPDGRFFLYYKSWDRYNDNLRKMGVAISDNLEGPYEKYEGNPIISFADYGQQAEDAYVWYENDKFHMIMRDMGLVTGYTGIYFSSEDGLHWSNLQRAYQNSEFYFPGEGVRRFERPQILFKDGKSEYLFMALAGGRYGTASGAVLKIGEW